MSETLQAHKVCWGNATLATVGEVPRIIIGMQKLVMYDFLPQKPRHGRVAWTDGIWAEIQTHLPECQERHCLLLLTIDPATKRQTFQHGDPGPAIEIDPQRAGFANLKGWLQKVHAEEDVRLASIRCAAPAQAGAEDAGRRGLLGRLFGKG